MTNNLELKNFKEQYDPFVYENLIDLAKTLSHLLSEMEERFIKKSEKNTSEQVKRLQAQQFNSKKSLLESLHEIEFNLKMVIRFYFCNIGRLLDGKNQVSFIKSISEIFNNLAAFDNTTHETLSFLL